MLQLFGLKVRSEGCTWICSQPFDPPQTEAWMIDRWGVLIGENSHNHANQAMSTPLTCSRPFCVPNDDDYAESWPSPCSQCTFLFFFFFLWFCHPEVHLSEEKPAAAGQLAAGSLGLVGARHCSDVDMPHRTSGSIRLSLTLVQVSALLGWTCSGIDQGSRKTVREWQFSPQGNSLAK